MTITQIIKELGGEQLISYKLGVHQVTVGSWVKRGIPIKHWAKLITLSKGKLSAEILLKSIKK